MTEEGSSRCFVIMPISVPAHLLERYGDRQDHFTKIYDTLLRPAISAAGLEPVSPIRSGSENIQAGIINDLQGVDLVVADLSALNPNVFLELGIRSALDKPVCLVSDGLDALPFDTNTINTHKYDPRPVYELNSEIERLTMFIDETMAKSDGRNELWRFFGSASKLRTAELDPEDASMMAKIDRLLEFAEHQRTPIISEPLPDSPSPSQAQIDEVVEVVAEALATAGAEGVHGAQIRKVCVSYLGTAYEPFLRGGSLNGRLAQLGVKLRTDDSGRFFGSSDPSGERG